MRIIVTGGAGFIGSNLVDQLLALGHEVLVVDNLSTGKKKFLESAFQSKKFVFENLDLLDSNKLNSVMKDIDAVVHLAANADVRFGWEHPYKDYEQNVQCTQNVLESMRINGVKKLIFSSTGSVYGESATIPTPEDAPFPLQTSLYGASKLSAEGLIQAYAEAGFINATIFRFVSILGPRYTHGHIFDFFKQLRANPDILRILGDGSQRKSYLHVSDCVSAILTKLSSQSSIEVFNLGLNDYVDVSTSAKRICSSMNLEPTFEFSGGNKGWVGDNPFILLDTTKICSTGWTPSTPLLEAIDSTVEWLDENQWVFE